MGSVELELGPMFSDKTTSLMFKLKKYYITGKKTILIKHTRDTRKKNHRHLNTSHDGLCMNAINVSSLEQDPEISEDIEVIGVDEGHFFPHLHEFCLRWLPKGVTIIIAALNGTYERKPFPVISKLIPLADNIIFHHSVCVICSAKDASCSVKTNVEAEVDENGILVGGDDMFTVTCSRCYSKEITKEHLEARKKIVEEAKKLIKWNN